MLIVVSLNTDPCKLVSQSQHSVFLNTDKLFTIKKYNFQLFYNTQVIWHSLITK